MAKEIEYDDSQLEKMFEELEPKRRLQAMRGGFRKASAIVRKEAISQLRSTKMRPGKDIEKVIHAKVYKRTAGFKVSVGTGKRGIGMHKNRRGHEKPVLIWWEDGTQDRETKPKIGTKRRGWRLRQSHRTGRIAPNKFMAKAKTATNDKVSDELHNQIRLETERIAKKYGCKT